MRVHGMKCRRVFLLQFLWTVSLSVVVLLINICFIPVQAGVNSIDNSYKLAETQSLLVQPQWLKSHLHENGLVVVDTRLARFYHAGHINNAINIPVVSTFDDKPHDDLVAPISHIRQLFSRAGIGNDTHVIVYDDGDFINAARVFWVLEVYGHQHVTMLDGGYTLWANRGLPVSTATGKYPPATFIPTIVPEHLSTKFSTRLAIDDDSKIIIDARSKDEYKGLKSETARKGHIPRAISIPFSENIDTLPDGSHRIKSIRQLTSLYKDIDRDKKVITYCNRGKQSALTYFILRQLGFNVSAYDGSWVEWSADASLPVAGPGVSSYDKKVMSE